MRAWRVEAFDAPIVLRTVEVPRPGPDEVLIRVAATGLNFADLLMMKGTYQETPPLPFSPGLEIAGEIIELGANVTHLIRHPDFKYSNYANDIMMLKLESPVSTGRYVFPACVTDKKEGI